MRTDFVIYYAGSPVYWQSKLQTEITLSTAEAEYIAMSVALREMIPLATTMPETNVFFSLYLPSPKIDHQSSQGQSILHCNGENPKFTPQTKHIAIKYHHFLEACHHSSKSRWAHSA